LPKEALVKGIIARGLIGLVAVAVSSAPARALADGTEVVAAVAPSTPPESAPLPASPPVTRTDLRVAALVTAGVALVAAGAGVVFGVLALNDKSHFDDQVNGTMSLGTVRADQAANSASENAVAADVCFGGAVVAAVTSIVLFVRSESVATGADAAPKGQGALHFTVSPVMTPHGGGAGAVLRF
jgi:hypothetical protein